ncbi:MAG TPA: type III-A CRISPR-associated protein Cas10/Csm1, partial [Caldilineaceae bacterium]|nr:type III-A CRISPR-associated protein Cas10/Csm1 [Caldilineaceae bacterium]
DAEVALLVGADLSGVQDFLYTITSRGATSALRGRSFYLQLLTEAAARFVLRELGLPSCNLLYAGGGSFYLLAAPQQTDALVEVQRRISRALLHHHRGDLYLALAATPLRGRDFWHISAAWQQLGERLQEAKLRRFAELDPSDQARLFAPQEDGGDEERQCQVCGLEHPDSRADEADAPRKCPACRSYEALGKDLRRARFLLLEQIELTAVELDAAPGDYNQSLAALGLRVQVNEALPSLPAARATLLALEDGALAELRPPPKLAVGRRFLVNATSILRQEEIDELRRGSYREEADDEPLQPGHIKPFSVLAWESKGIKRLGVLRMDVDNLGQLFAKGLGDLATLSRVASLSFAISLYFEGWVEQIAQQYEGRIYSIYSGGDDLFFVGAWDAVVEFARNVRADFTAYAAGHPGLHTSAGMALAAGKYPLAQAARDAGDAEDAAKAYQGPNGWRKNAISFLGVTQPWTRFGLELECTAGSGSVHALMHLLLAMTDPVDGEAGAPKALLRSLVRLYDQYQEAWEERRRQGRDVNQAGELQALWGPWMWQGVYMLSRMADRLKGQPALRRQVEELRHHLEQEQFRNMDWIGLAARWAELLSR